MNGTEVAFVAGATGYTGRAVVERLRELGVEANAHVRPDSQRLAEWRARFEALGARVDTTVWSAADMRARFVELRPTHVFATLGTTLARSRRGSTSSVPDSYAAVDRALTQMLIDASVAAGSVERFVYISAAGVRSGTKNVYLRARAENEAALRASGLGHTIARPAFVTGNDRDEARPLERVGAITSDAFFAACRVFGASAFASRYGSISGTVLARGLVQAAFEPLCKDVSLHSGELRGDAGPLARAPSRLS